MNVGKSHRLSFGIRSIVLLLLVVSVVGSLGRISISSAQTPTTPAPEPLMRDVVYCRAAGESLKLDIYAPTRTSSVPAPAAMFVHGGAWSTGDKVSSEGAPEITELVNRGYMVASVDYRLAPRYIFPSQIEDVKCAVRYLRANAPALNIDPSRIGAWGASAGGHLVSLLGTTDQSANMEGDGGYSNQSSRVQAVVDLYGRADLTTIPQTRPDLLPIFGGADNLARYSPVTYVSRDDPPFLIIHGDQDTTVPPQLSQEFYSRLRADGVPATLVMVKNAGHGFMPVGGSISPSRAELTHMVGDFFDRYLKEGSKPRQSTTAKRVAHAAALPAGGDSLKCDQTGKTVRGVFLDYWKAHGGLAQQGYPISGELLETSAIDGKVYTVQYFERAVLEYHPGGEPQYDVLPSLLGAQLYRGRYPSGAPGQRPNESADSTLFEQTGHRVGGPFLEYWQQHGGVMQQGYPISDEFTEISTLDGRPYTVQYFERAVLEMHPDNDPANRVLLSQLGTFKYRQSYSSDITSK